MGVKRGTLALWSLFALGAALLPSDLMAQATQWQDARLLSGRAYAPMAFDAIRGKTVILGGQGIDGASLGDTWEYDGVAWERRSAGGGPPPGFGYVMAYDEQRRRTVMFSGSTPTNTWLWDGDRWELRLPPSSPQSPGECQMGYDSVRGRVVLLLRSGATSHTWEWDGTTWQLTATTGPQGTNLAHGLAFDLGRQRMVLYVPTSAGQPGQTWEYDGVSWLLRASANSPISVWGSALAFDQVLGRTIMFGGVSNATFGGTYEWNGTTWQAVLGTSPAGRSGSFLAYDARRSRVVLFGGLGTEGGNIAHYFTDTWERSGATWTQSVPPTQPFPRRWHAAAADEARGSIVVHGGTFAGQLLGAASLADTWEWNGRAWHQYAGPGPGPVSGSAMAFDAARQEVLLFGGVGAFPTNQTWVWTGAWQQRSPTASPSPRHGHAMVFDRARQRVLVFGGNTANLLTPTTTFLGDTWEWDGVTWLLRQPPTSPPGRHGHQMAYDTLRQQTVLHGGLVAGGGTASDTWEWDGITWALRAASSAAGPRHRHAMAYDATLQRVVMTGGDFGPLALWQWDGTNWSTVAATNVPAFASELTLTPDPQRGRLLRFGGFRFGPRHETQWFGPLVPPVAQTVGSPCPSSSPLLLTSDESHFANADFQLELVGVAPSGLCVLGYAAATQPVAIGPCTLYLDGPIVAEAAVADGFGVARSTPWSHAAVSTFRGWQFYAQAIALDSSAPLGLVFTAMRSFTLGD